MIRRATLDDVPEIMEMAVEFYRVSELPYEFVHSDMADHLAWLTSEGGVFRSKTGAIGGLIQSMPFNASVKFMNGHFWWGPDGDGLRLLRAFERDSKERGASLMTMNILASVGEKAEKILKHCGYKPRETGHVREL